MAYLSRVLEKTRTFIESKSKEERKEYGQFFTTGTSAQFMSSMFDIDTDKDSLNILDAGAGSGILTVALVDHLLDIGYTGKINVTCYENDAKILPILRSISVDYNTVVAKNSYVYLVTNKQEIECLGSLKNLGNTLVSDGLPMKTGIIVDFRTRDVLRNNGNEPNTYPLLYSQHIKNGKIVWPVGKENEYICTNRKGYLQENTNYVLVKRFTAKEERRRLQCGIYLKKDYPNYKYISTQNKVNYILCQEEDEALGVYCLLNSSIYDLYYRILNGSTQVNSTEINNMPVPDKHTIIEMGKRLRGEGLSTEVCDKIVSQWIN